MKRKRNKKITKKEKRNELTKEIDLFTIIAILFILVFIYIYPTITGLTVYSQSYYNWTFSNPEDYIYNESLIEINNQVKLKEIPYDFTNYLISDYHLDEEIWVNTSVEDSTGNNPGTAYNGAETTSEGKINRASSFDGLDDYIDLGNDSSLMPNEFTILAWIKLNQLPGNKEWYGIISKGDYDSGNGYELYIRDSKTDTEPNKICFGLDTTRIYSNNIPSTNEWIHIVITYDGTTIKIYINTNLEDSNTAILNTNNLPVYIGRRYSNEEYVFNGLIDEVSIYNKALTQEEIQIIYNQQNQESRSYTYFSENASLETSNLDIPNVNQQLLFSKNEQLNGQEINYYYSDDNGYTWNLIPENNSLPSLEQIKIKSEFNSDTTTTPILYNMILTYESCTESWNCSSWSDCYENSTKSRTCTDLNECGSLDNKPNEIENCTYSSPCEENWTCTAWSTCIDNNQTRICSDLNECNTTISQPIEIQNCTIEETPQETPSSSGSSGGGGSGGSRTFTKPAETTTTETKSVETPTIKEETQETSLKTETQENPLQKVTGFVSYNIGREGINIVLLTFLISLSSLLYFRSKFNLQ